MAGGDFSVDDESVYPVCGEERANKDFSWIFMGKSGAKLSDMEFILACATALYQHN